MKWDEIIAGSALIAIALFPTPDDITVISPTAQLLAGAVLLLDGLGHKDTAKRVKRG